MKINLLKILFLITFFLLFLPSLCFPVAIGTFAITAFFVFSILTFGYCLIFNFKFLAKNVKHILKYNAAKYLIIYFVIQFYLILFYIFFGWSKITVFLSILVRFLSYVLPFMLAFIVAKYINTKTMIKVVYTIILLTFLFGIFEFIAFYFDISALTAICNIIYNKRLILIGGDVTRAVTTVIPRIQSVFDEPCYFALFITTLLPMIYKLSYSNYKIYKYNFTDKFVKKLMPVLCWINLIGTQSPIFLVFASIVSGIYFLYAKGVRFKFNIKTAVMLIFTAIFVFCILHVLTNSSIISGTFLYRIQFVLQTFKDINMMILIEPSLGRRIFDIINLSLIFTHNPIFGAGFGNLVNATSMQVMQSPVIHTQEIISSIQRTGVYAPTPNIFFSSIAETGLMGTIPLYMFFISVYLTICKLSKYAVGLEYEFVFGLKNFVLIYVILSLYDSSLFIPYGLAFFGICLATSYRIKKEMHYEDNNS